MSELPTPDRSTRAVSAYTFQVKPLAGRWGIICGGEVIAITATEQEAAALAISAAGVLRMGRRSETVIAPEERSFAKW